MAAPSPTASAIGGVPASNFQGSSAQLNPSRRTSLIISPPPRNGGMASSSSRRAHRTPMPVGPSILWPEKATKSAPRAPTSIVRWGADLGGVDQDQGPGGVGRLGQGGDVVDGAEHVGDPGDAEELGAVEQAGKVGQVEVAVGRKRDPAQLDAPLGGQHVPGHDVGVVLHVGEHHGSPACERRAAPGVGHQVRGLGGAPGEDDLPGRGGADEAGGLGPGLLVGGGGLLGQGVDAAVHVGVALRVVVVERVEHRPGASGTWRPSRDRPAACR